MGNIMTHHEEILIHLDFKKKNKKWGFLNLLKEKED